MLKMTSHRSRCSMLVFKNAEKDTHFIVRNNRVEHVGDRTFWTLHEYSDLMGGGMEILTLPDLKTVQKFRKLIETKVLENVPLEDAKTVLMDKYPEYFI